MKIVHINNDEIKFALDLAKKRHDAKPNSIRNTGILIDRDKNNPLLNYLPHLIGIFGEMAWAKYTNRKVDEAIYSIRDSEDFEGEEVKTITYFGSGEPELKIKVTEYNTKKPNNYILVRTSKQKIEQILFENIEEIDVELLGYISRKDFDQKKTKKQYGYNNPLNYVVSLSQMKAV
jgi:hypothetical protein